MGSYTGPRLQILPLRKLVKVITKRGLWLGAQTEAECHNTAATDHNVQCARFPLYMQQRYPREKKSLTCGWSFKLEPVGQLK